METEPIDFFENVGYLTQNGSLDKRMVWNLLVWELSAYYKALTRRPNLIEDQRTQNAQSEVYSEIQWLYEQFRSIDIGINKNGKKASRLVEPSGDDLETFLRSETKLGHDKPTPTVVRIHRDP